jgi:hypothetical protein
MGVTTEQLRAIERWENEGGKVSPALTIMPSRQMEIRGNENQLIGKLSSRGKTRPGGWYSEAQSQEKNTQWAP